MLETNDFSKKLSNFPFYAVKELAMNLWCDTDNNIINLESKLSNQPNCLKYNRISATVIIISIDSLKLNTRLFF